MGIYKSSVLLPTKAGEIVTEKKIPYGMKTVNVPQNHFWLLENNNTAFWGVHLNTADFIKFIYFLILVDIYLIQFTYILGTAA